MDNEKLIEFVREYKCLYDLTDKKYSDNQKKDQVWNEIGIKLESNGSECKKAWTQLRDSFRRFNKKRKDTKSGQASVPEKKWKYEEEMSFLLPYMKERPTICPIPAIPIDVEEGDIAQSPEDMRLLPESESTPEDSQQTDGLSTHHSTHQLITNSSPATIQNNPRLKRIKRGQRRTVETPSTVLMKYIIDSKKNTPPPDDIEQFMAGITTTLRSFPPRDRAIAKSKIFKIVSDMEIDILSRPSTSNIIVSTPYLVKCEPDIDSCENI